jgi:serine/threonine protein kinase
MNPLAHYRLTNPNPIAEGGFAFIYQVEHTLLGTYACLKQNKDANPDHAALLRAEAQLLWNLDGHHSLPTVREFYMPDDKTAIAVLSFIEGKTLDTIVQTKGRLHPEDACWIAERLLGALHYVHGNGIIHGDVKPQNIIIEPKKRDIKLIDFGLAARNPTRTTKPLGSTAFYAAPELLDGKPPIPETDLYGAGIALLYALGGDVPTKSLPTDVPEPIAQFCNQLLLYDPLQRPHWGKNNPLETLSDIRFEVFGRRHIR